jgi:hypothetical protein
MPEIWHICANSWQNPRAVASGTLLEKFIQAQWFTLHPLITFCQNELLLGTETGGTSSMLVQQEVCNELESYLVYHVPLTNLW